LANFELSFCGGSFFVFVDVATSSKDKQRQSMMSIQFDDKTIQSIFGVDDAENEKEERLKSYFFKNNAYKNLTNDLPIRVVVGHKGIGKSALLRMCTIEDQEQSRPNILLRPDEFSDIKHDDDFNQMVFEWKDKLLKLIAHHFLNQSYTGVPGKFISGLVALFKDITDNKALKASTSNAYSQLIRTKAVSVYIDDLDRGWRAENKDIVRLSALLNAIRDIAGAEKGIRFIVALRTDVYHLVRTSDESTDKIEQNVVPLEWSQHEILFLMAKRIALYFERDVSSLVPTDSQRKIASYLHLVIDEKFEGVGRWRNQPIHKVLMSLTRKRPRDLIKLMSAAGKEAYRNGHQKIHSKDLSDILNNYSQERLQDLINEFKSELPQIERLLYAMKTTKQERRNKVGNVYSKGELIQKLKNIIQQNTFAFATRQAGTPQNLAEFLYRIEFVTARKETEIGIERMYYGDNKRLMGLEDFGFKWEIHPAYRWALQPDNQIDIFKQLEISENVL
jgi:hypothetical protein